MSKKTKALWTVRARNVVRGEMARRGLSYEALAAKLKQNNIDETPGNLRTKISRGTFSFAFALQVLHVIGCKSVDIDVD